MSVGLAAAMAEYASGKPVFTAPATCPFFPGTEAVPTSITVALTGYPMILPVLLARPHSPAAVRTAASKGQFRAYVGRGPPNSTFS